MKFYDALEYMYCNENKAVKIVGKDKYYLKREGRKLLYSPDIYFKDSLIYHYDFDDTTHEWEKFLDMEKATIRFDKKQQQLTIEKRQGENAIGFAHIDSSGDYKIYADDEIKEILKTEYISHSMIANLIQKEYTEIKYYAG